MTPTELRVYLNRCVAKQLRISIMIWGPPGIGKSSIVNQVAKENNLNFIDLRLSQLAPTDLRGLPVADNGISKWYPPDFLPRTGKGILFLDEINMAPPAMQAIAQQLILDRHVGSYKVPDEWFIWAAGNRKEDRASVFDMPAPLANRFLHLQIESDFESFRVYALENNIHEELIAFLSFCPLLLHQQDPHQPAWPSPRSWEMASMLYKAGLDIAPAVGTGTAAELTSFLRICETIPDFLPILEGKGNKITLPEEPSVKYAVVTGLAFRAGDANQAYNAFAWLDSTVVTAEWMQLYAVNVFPLMRKKGQIGQFASLIQQEPKLQKLLNDYQQLAGW